MKMNSDLVEVAFLVHDVYVWPEQNKWEIVILDVAQQRPVASKDKGSIPSDVPKLLDIVEKQDLVELMNKAFGQLIYSPYPDVLNQAAETMLTNDVAYLILWKDMNCLNGWKERKSFWARRLGGAVSEATGKDTRKL